MGLLNIDEKTAPVPINNDNIQNHRLVVTLTEPIEREIKNQFNLNLKLLDLRKIASDRNNYVHQSIDSVDQQEDFLEECRSFQFSAHYKYINILEQLIEKLTEFENATPVTQLRSLNLKT